MKYTSTLPTDAWLDKLGRRNSGSFEYVDIVPCKRVNCVE
jgi:hypothetical protein